MRPEGGFELRFGGADAMRLSCNTLINAAGLRAQALARRIDGVPAASIPASYLCKGSYFTLSGRAPFSRLIYPVPQHAGLGVHLTLDLGGQAKFGPDTEWVDSEDYTWTRPAPTCSTRRYAATGPPCPTTRWRPATLASARRSPACASRPPIS